MYNMKMYALKITNCSKKWSNKFQALSNLNLAIEKGDFYALLGSNGAGKSTLIGIVCSLVKMDSGTIEVFGKNLSADRIWCKRQIGLVPQEFNFNQWEPVGEIVANTAGLFGYSLKESTLKARETLGEVGLLDKINDKAVSLSGGMKRRLMIARAMVSKPRLLILDEPTAGVDIEIRHEIWDDLLRLNANGTTILLTTHYLEEAEKLCRTVGFIAEGKMQHQGSIKEVTKYLDEKIFKISYMGNADKFYSNWDKWIRNKGKGSFELILKKDMLLSDVFDIFAKHNLSITDIKPLRGDLEEAFLQINQLASSQAMDQ